VDAGAAGALDVGQMELELHQSRLALLKSRQETADAEAALSLLIGVHPSQFAALPDDALSELPIDILDLGHLKQLMVENGLDLAMIRGEYEVAESRLRLEIIKQYPDFELGTTFEKDPGETSRTFELTIGFDLPIFDRNQQGIAEARLHREELREKYAAAANRALAKLEHACRTYDLAREKLKWLKDNVLPRARSNVDVAKKSVAAARIDSLQYLEAERALNDVLIDTVEGELELRKSLIGIEQAVGRPLWLFPSEEEGMIPPLPDNLDQPTSSSEEPEEGSSDNMESGS
jgi:cobalt-zinc-cadmium efflux system outer membrane protein